MIAKIINFIIFPAFVQRLLLAVDSKYTAKMTIITNSAKNLYEFGALEFCYIAKYTLAGNKQNQPEKRNQKRRLLLYF